MSRTNFIENFIAGGVGGFCTVATGHPFDTIKVRLQTLPSNENGPTYTGAWDCVRKTVKNEGFRALYKGMLAPLISMTPVTAIFFGGCALGRRLIEPHEKITFVQNFYAGAFAGICTAVIKVPGERIKCILQVQSNENIKKYDGPFDAAKKIYKEGGIRNLYRGSVATLIRVPHIKVFKRGFMSRTNFIENFVAGGVGGACTVATGHPFDTVKVRLQTMSNLNSGRRLMYAGTMDCVRKTVKNEGFRALYKGMVAPLISMTPVSAIYFGGCSLGRKFQNNEPGEKFTFVQNFKAGAFAGICTAVIEIPIERIKCLLQVQSYGRLKKYGDPVDVLKKLYKEGGIRNIYHGSVATLIRDIPSAGMFISVYELLKNYFVDKSNKSTISPLAALFSGGCAGIASWSVCIPADVIKSRIQTASVEKYKNGIRSVILEIWQQEGPKGFFRGFTPVMLRAFPANAACFLGIELTLDIIRLL